MVGFGAYALQSQSRPLAHLEIRQQQASQPAPQRTSPDSEVVPEQLVEDVVVAELPPEEPPVEPSQQPPTEPLVVDDRVWPSDVLQAVTLERVQRPAPPAPAVVPKESRPQVFLQAQRSDNVEPVYPKRERRQMREGLVVVRVVVA